MVPYQAIFFDFDYTLGDATPSILAGFAYGLDQLGWPAPDADEIRRTVGYPLEESYTKLTGDRDPIHREQFRAYFTQAAQARQREEAVLLPGATELLRWLGQKGVKRAVVSTKRRTLCGAFWSTGVWQTSLRWYSAATMSPTVSRTPRGFCLLWNNWKSRPPRCYTVGTPFWTRRRPSGPDAIFRQSSTGPPQGRIFSPFPMSISLRTCQSYWIGLENRPDDPVGTAAWAGHSRPFCL